MLAIDLFMRGKKCNGYPVADVLFHSVFSNDLYAQEFKELNTSLMVGSD